MQQPSRLTSGQSFSDIPDVSIIIIVGGHRRRAARALNSLLVQAGLDRSEIILVGRSSADIAGLAESQQPPVKLLIPTSFDYGAMKAEAVQLARGRIVAFLEDHAFAAPGWLQGILGSLHEPWVAVGGAVRNANAGVGLSGTMAILNYGLWMPPLAEGESQWVAGNNSAYLREALLEAGEELAVLLATDMVLQFWLKVNGHRFFINPAIEIEHLNETRMLDAMRALFFYHWCFAPTRARMLSWSLSQRLLHLTISPLVPWLRWFRLLRLANERGRLDEFKPLLALLLLHVAVMGQNLGLIFGSDGGRRRMADIELEVSRDETG